MNCLVKKVTSLFIALLMVMQGLSLFAAESKTEQKRALDERQTLKSLGSELLKLKGDPSAPPTKADIEAVFKMFSSDKVKAGSPLLSFNGVQLNVIADKGKSSKYDTQTIALFIAAADNQLEDARRAIESGADIEARNLRGETPLMIAAQLGHQLIIEELIRHGVKLDTPQQVTIPATRGKKMSNAKMPTALDFAIANGRLSTAYYLVSKGAHVDSDQKNDLLVYAARNGDQVRVKTLLDAKADISQETLQQVEETGNAAIIQLLKETAEQRAQAAEATAASFDSEKPTACATSAAAKKKKKKAKAKTKKTASAGAGQSKLAQPTTEQLKALEAIKAKKKRDDEVYQAQLEAFRINLEREQTENALKQVQEKEAKEREALLKLTDEEQLIKAATTGKLADVQSLLDKNVNPNCTNKAGNLTPLGVALQFGHYQIAAALQGRGANPVSLIVNAHLNPKLLQLEQAS